MIFLSKFNKTVLKLTSELISNYSINKTKNPERESQFSSIRLETKRLLRKEVEKMTEQDVGG